jgi:thiamine-phosphate pyrophosphorylase
MTRAERLSKLRGLYGVVDDGAEFELLPLTWAKALADGGCSVIQLRFKRTPAREALAQARRIRAELPEVLLLVNDRIDLALLAEADGVHLGEGDLPVAEARGLLGPERLIGATVRNSAAGRDRIAEGADYLGAGPVFASSTKPLDTQPLGTNGLQQLCRALPETPVVAISGIDAANIAAVARTGARAAAVIGAIGRARDPEQVARLLSERFAAAMPP